MNGHLPIYPIEGTEPCAWFGCPNTADSWIWDTNRQHDVTGCRFHITAYRRALERGHHPSTK